MGRVGSARLGGIQGRVGPCAARMRGDRGERERQRAQAKWARERPTRERRERRAHFMGRSSSSEPSCHRRAPILPSGCSQARERKRRVNTACRLIQPLASDSPKRGRRQTGSGGAPARARATRSGSWPAAAAARRALGTRSSPPPRTTR